MASINKRLKQFREVLGLTQQEMAAKTKISRTYISTIEAGRQEPSFSFLKTLSTSLNLSTDWLLTGEGEMFQHTVPPIEPAASPLPNDIGEAVELMQEMSTFERRLFLALLRMKRDEVAEGTDRAAKKAVNKRVEVGSPQIT